MNESVKKANKMQIEKIITNMKKRNMAAFYCEDKEEAYAKVMALIEEETVVGWGGSATLAEIGIKEGLKERNVNVIDPYTMADPKESMAAKMRLLRSDSFLMSSNAVTLDGKLVNIDGLGNRVAALCFGPKQVIVVVGANKIVDTEEAAIRRIKTKACPPNAVRLSKETPCGLTGTCASCKIPDQTICSMTVVNRYSYIPDRIKVILVNEELGF